MKNKKVKYGIIGIIAFIPLIIGGLLVKLAINYSTLDDDEKKISLKCHMSGGSYKYLADGCADFCGRVSGCAKVPTKSCDCGKNKCWDKKEKKCKPNPK